MDYQKLVKYRNKFRLESVDLARLTSFRKENIEKAIMMQDILDSKNSGEWCVKSRFLKERGNTRF